MDELDGGRYAPPEILELVDPGPAQLGYGLPIRTLDVEVMSGLVQIGVWTLAGDRRGYRAFCNVPDVAESLDAFVELATRAAVWATYNGLAYDAHIVKLLLDGERDPAKFLELSHSLIEGKVRGRCRDLTPNSEHLDLFAMHKANHGLLGSLKSVAQRIHFPIIATAPFAWDAELNREQIGTLIGSYNLFDAALVAWLLVRLQGDIELRRRLSELHDIDAANTPDSSLGEAILMKRLFGVEHKTKLPRHAYTSATQWTLFADEVLHEFHFRDPVLREAMDVVRGWQLDFKAIERDDKREISKPRQFHEFRYADLLIRFGLGGLHSIDSAAIIEADAQWTVLELDISAFYPHLIRTFELCPAHLRNTPFRDVFNAMIDARQAAVEVGDKLGAQAAKTANNSVFGKTKSAWSPLCDPAMGANVTLAGQALLLQLMEVCRAVDAEAVRLVGANTDGVVLFVPRTLADAVIARARAFAEIYGMKVQVAEIQRLCRRDGNNYAALLADGSVKARGDFATAEVLTKSNALKIVAQAAVACLLFDVPVEQTVAECRDIRPFIDHFKCSSGWTLCDLEGKELGTQARWILVNDGFDLQKRKSDAKPMQVAGARGVRLMPVLPTGYGVPADLDRARYVALAVDLVRSVTEPKQRRDDRLGLSELSAAQQTLFAANATQTERNPAQCRAVDLERFRARYQARIEAQNPYDSMRGTLYGLWSCYPGALGAADLVWCAQEIADEDYWAVGDRPTKLRDMAESIAAKVVPWKKPQTPAQCAEQALAWAEEAEIKLAKRRVEFYYNSISSTNYYTATQLGNYAKKRDLPKLAFAIAARAKWARAAMDAATLAGVLQTVREYFSD